MQQFSLDIWLQDKSRKVVTRDGKSARIICIDKKGPYPLVALIENGYSDLIREYTINGRFYNDDVISETDLSFADEDRLTEFEQEIKNWMSEFLLGTEQPIPNKMVKQAAKKVFDLARKKQGEIVKQHEDELDRCACKYFDKGYKSALETQGERNTANFEEAEKEKNDFVSGQFIECRKSFIAFKEFESYWLEYVGDDTYIGRSDNVLSQRFHITPQQLFTLFTHQHCPKDNENQGEQNPVDKVEPKFKDGDWVRAISSGNIFKILSVNDGLYRVLCYDGVEANYPIEDVEKDLSYWTIQDAKDGDVLCGYPTDDYHWIGIFHELNDDYTFKSYCYLQAGITGKFCPPSGVNIFNRRNVDGHNSEFIVPATKEQRDILFQKMKEAGYEWDSKKKELKKIEQKHAWSEEDERILNKIQDHLREFYVDKKGYPYVAEPDSPEMMENNWLMCIKNRVQPQPKKEWSEKDERLLSCLIKDQEEALDEVRNDKYGHSEIISDLKEMYRERIDWLKSLKERYTWKPSKEQMEALMLVCRGSNLTSLNMLKSLYHDLKKL